MNFIKCAKIIHGRYFLCMHVFFLPFELPIGGDPPYGRCEGQKKNVHAQKRSSMEDFLHIARPFACGLDDFVDDFGIEFGCVFSLCVCFYSILLFYLGSLLKRMFFSCSWPSGLREAIR